MTIINSVIIGGGSGDEVEAYALGDAKNAVKDDKVTLNFSAGILPIEESVAVSSSTDYFFTGYAKNTEAVFLSGSYAYVFKKNPNGVWSKTSTTSFGSRGVNKQCSPFGLLIDSYAGTGFKVTNGYLTSLDYGIAGRSYEPRDRALFSTTGEYCAVFSDAGSGYKTVVYYKNSLLQVLDEWSGASYDSVPRFFFANKDGVEYLFVGNTGSLVRVQTPHTYRLTPDGAEYLGRFSVSRQNGDYVNIYATASVGDLLITSSNDDYTTLSSIGMFKTEVDPTQKTVVLKDASKEFTSFRSVVNFPTEEGLNLVPTGDVNIIQYRGGCVKYNPSEGTFEPYLPTGVMSDRVFYNADERVAVKIIDNTTGFNLYRLLQPIEQPYVATTFTDRSYCSSSGLTGIVKENNNGVLKVSTVEDPNNPPPAVPDEAGLKTVINYGGGVGINTNLVIADGITKTGTDLSGFTNSSDYKVTTASPFISLSSVSFFDIVMCATHPADGGYYHWLAGLTDNANAYRGFDIRTEGNNFLEANIYHEDGTSTYLKSGITLPTNTKTFIKLSYNSSSGYTLSFSSDGVSYTQVASVTETKPMDITPPILYLGWRPPKQQSTYYWNGTIHLADCYIKVNGTKIWSGVKPVFGSVGVGYGYFKNTYFYPLGGQASKDKYVPYDGGVLTEDNILGEKATTMNIYLGRSADMGSWVSDTKGYLSTRESIVASVSKKLPTPVYLWHDLSYITPAVPETLVPQVKVSAGGYVPNGNIVGSPTVSDDVVMSNFSSANYLELPTSVIPSGSEPWTFVTKFNCTSVSTEQGIIGYRGGGLFRITINSSRLGLDLSTNSSSWNIGSITGMTTLSNNTDYWVKAEFTGSAYKLYLSTDGQTYSEQGTLNTSSVPTWPSVLTYGLMNAFAFNGSLYLQEAYFEKSGVRVWTGAVQDYGTVSFPASWKTLDGVVYEYPNGFPTTQASDLEANIVEGSNNLYVTKTGDSCGLAISSTSPAGVDSSAVIGTVELDANGAITSYTPGE